MKVTQVAIRPTEQSNRAGRPSLTPELLAASGARYSRNNEGLDAILANIDPDNLDKSVDSIFRMVDYGHQSIADMVPVALFIDSISIWLAYYVWTLCPMAGGQESSTRYIKLSPDGLVDPSVLGIRQEDFSLWERKMANAFESYQAALNAWDTIATEQPAVLRIPLSLMQDSTDQAKRQVRRMVRNYSFDRSRYFLPVAATTNMMMVMSARNWAQLCQHLLSHPLQESRKLGDAVRSELQLTAPRLIRHATAKPSHVAGLRNEFNTLVRLAGEDPSPYLHADATVIERPPRAEVAVFAATGASDIAMCEDLVYHNDRYAYIGELVRRSVVRFGWDAVAMAEIRDLNRHRTGTKYCPLVPLGFYQPIEQVPESPSADHNLKLLKSLGETGRDLSARALEKLSLGDASYIYWSLLGTQFQFEHTTTLDKYVYEAELRTGTGAHFRYAKHLVDSIDALGRQYPSLARTINIGTSEPE